MAQLAVKATITTKSSLPKIRGQANSVAIRVLNETLQNIGLATAKGLAPGSIPSQIFVIPAKVEQRTKVVGGLGMPAKYASVEVGARPHPIAPVNAQVLLLEDGNFVAFVERHPGQEAQHFLFEGLTAVQQIVGGKIINGITGTRSSGSRR